MKRAELCVLFNERSLPIAFASWLPYAQTTGRSIDLMRHLSIHRGVMDALITESLLDFQRRGLSQASLGNAPLANIESGSLDCLEERVICYLFERFDAYYGYKSLFEFKKKFHPIWRGRHVAYRNVAYLLPAVAAIVRVHLPRGFLKVHPIVRDSRISPQISMGTRRSARNENDGGVFRSSPKSSGNRGRARGRRGTRTASEAFSLPIECRRIDFEDLGDFFQRLVIGDQPADVLGLDLFQIESSAEPDFRCRVNGIERSPSSIWS